MVVQLVSPNVKYEKTVRDAILELAHEGASLDWYYRLNENFDEYVQELLGRKTTRTDRLVPETVLWAVKSGVFVGRISIRHELNENLARVGGHIGYEVRPSYRRQGIASEMLKLCLPIAKEVGLEKALLTCDDTNLPSVKTIEKNGGILEKKLNLGSDKPLKRHYWIQL